MHQKIHVIEICGNPNNIQNIMKKTRKDNQKVGKIGQAINQTPTQKLKHDKI
jgi:hypothetical protein